MESSNKKMSGKNPKPVTYSAGGKNVKPTTDTQPNNNKSAKNKKQM